MYRIKSPCHICEALQDEGKNKPQQSRTERGRDGEMGPPHTVQVLNWALKMLLEASFLEKRLFVFSMGVVLLFWFWFLLPYFPRVWLETSGFFMIKQGGGDKILPPPTPQGRWTRLDRMYARLCVCTRVCVCLGGVACLQVNGMVMLNLLPSASQPSFL